MGSHDDAVRAVINRVQNENNVETTYVDNVDRYEDPAPVGGESPDMIFEFANGRTRIVEIDTTPMSDRDKTQDETFRRSAGQQSATTYKHYLAEDVL